MGFEYDDSFETNVKIKVIGVGGGGNNAVNRMIMSSIKGVELVSINTDQQALRKSNASTTLVIGEKLTRGFGAGANPQIGERAAEESIEEIKNVLKDADMVFITAGMGGGTGTGAAPVVARLAQEMNILTVGIVTKPFEFEGPRRMSQALRGIAELSQYVDSLIVIPNDRLKEVTDARITLANAFEIADSVLSRGTQSISDLVNVNAFINLDFADVTSVMKDAGYAHMGVGAAVGKDKAEIAARQAISSPLLESSISGARGILMSITASPDIGLEDATIASNLVASEASPDVNFIWGVAFDNELEDEMRITIIATGFDKKSNEPIPEIKAEEKVAAPARPVVKAAQPEIRKEPAVKSARKEINAALDDILNEYKNDYKRR